MRRHRDKWNMVATVTQSESMMDSTDVSIDEKVQMLMAKGVKNERTWDLEWPRNNVEIKEFGTKEVEGWMKKANVACESEELNKSTDMVFGRMRTHKSGIAYLEYIGGMDPPEEWEVIVLDGKEKSK